MELILFSRVDPVKQPMIVDDLQLDRLLPFLPPQAALFFFYIHRHSEFRFVYLCSRFSPLALLSRWRFA